MNVRFCGDFSSSKCRRRLIKASPLMPTKIMAVYTLRDEMRGSLGASALSLNDASCVVYFAIGDAPLIANVGFSGLYGRVLAQAAA